MSFSIGQQVGPYRVESRVGQGGMATVYKAYHESLDRYVAIKVMHIALSEEESFIERFRREAQIVARLGHANIIPIYDSAVYEHQPYIVMKYIEGETLKQRMRRQPLTLEEVTEVIDAVAGALDYAHENDVLHRDVKPSNVMLDGKGTPYLTDFGLARVASLGESTLSADVMLGTPQYISPEQARGVRQLDAGTDIYSLGVLLYELVVGRVPFTADTPYTIIHDHIYKPLPLPTFVNPGVPPQVEQVLVKVLAKERQQRYNTAGDLAVAMREAVRQSNMIEISWNTLRPEAFDDPAAGGQAATMMPSGTPSPMPMQQAQMPGVPSPMMPSGMTPSGNVIVPGNSVSYPIETASGNGWVITGCLLFIVTCLVSAGVLLGALNDERFEQTWEEYQAQVAAEDSEDVPLDDMSTDEITGEVLLFNAENGSLKQEQVDLYRDLNPNSVSAQLAQAYLFLQTDAAEEAQRLVQLASRNPNTENQLMLGWAELFASEGYDESALILFTTAYIREFDDPVVREEAGEYLYNQVSNLRGTNTEIICTLGNLFQNSPQLSMIVAQGLVSAFSGPGLDVRFPPDSNCPEVNGEETIIEIIELGLEADPNMAELYLVRGNYYELIDEDEMAEDNWVIATEFEDAPEWVISKAEAKIANLN